MESISWKINNVQNRSKVKIAVFILIFLAIIVGVSSLFLLGGSNVAKTPEIVTVKGIDFLEIDGSQLTLAVTMTVSNPNKIEMVLVGIDALLKVEGEYIGTVKDNNRHTLGSGELNTITVDAVINVAKSSDAFPALLEKDNVTFELSGLFKVDAFVKDITFNRQTEKQISIRDLVNRVVKSKISKNGFVIDKITPRSVGLFSTSLYLDIVLRNDFGIDYVMESISCDLFLPNKNNAFGNWRHTEDEITLKSNSTKRLSGEISISNENVLQNLATAIFGANKIEAKCDTGVRVAEYSFKVPFEKSTKIENVVGF